MTDSNNRRWMELAQELTSDEHPGARFLRAHLNSLRRKLTDSPTGELLFVPEERIERSWQGMVGVSHACSCIQVHFMYIRPKYRNTQAVLEVFRAIAQYGKKCYYGYVFMQCPLVDGMESVHSFFANLTDGYADEELPDQSVVRTYNIPSAAFEAVII